ncbi:hypothetical protein [Pseudobutyrivibrio sp.]
MDKLHVDVMAVVELLDIINTDVTAECKKGAADIFEQICNKHTMLQDRCEFLRKHIEKQQELDKRRKFLAMMTETVRKFTDEYMEDV